MIRLLAGLPRFTFNALINHHGYCDMVTAIWQFDVSHFYDLKLNIDDAKQSHDLSLSIAADRIAAIQNTGLTNFGVMPVLNLQGEKNAWTIRQVKGRIQGVEVRVSGLGAYARAKGSMNFATRVLESSKTYQAMRQSYGLTAGVRGFWHWLGDGANAAVYKQELMQVFSELSQSPKTHGNINVDLYVTGLYPNLPVSASTYILALEISSSIETLKFPVIALGEPTQDTGAQSQVDQILPTKDNTSTIDASRS